MSFLELKDKMFDLACFNVNQIYAWKPDFDLNNLTRWLKKGYIIRLRQGFYTFPEYKRKPDNRFYFANCIYQPSYISLHTALAFYGIIPEGVVQITNVTSLKTGSFRNELGDFTYQSVKSALMFGYELKPASDGRTVLFATPEKALLDLLYLYPFYNTALEMMELRLDDDFLHTELNRKRLMDYCAKFHSRALDFRLNLLVKTYNL